ncbi:hypothetical protein [Streptomyces sp. NPDC055055]
MTPRAEHDGRAGGALAHLLLVVVLALGVFLMHAVGHPEGSGGGSGAHVAGSGGGHAMAPAASTERAPATAFAGIAGSRPVAAPASPSHGAGGSDARHEPGAGTDMTTLCVAVLGAWLLAGLVRAALGRRPEWLTLLLARLSPARRPHAPPRRPPDLARLSVLRI